MRAAIAIALVMLALFGAAAPHDHGGSFGTHACAACLAAGAEEARAATPELVPRFVVSDAPLEPVALFAEGGAPLGAVPGQSPPLA